MGGRLSRDQSLTQTFTWLLTGKVGGFSACGASDVEVRFCVSERAAGVGSGPLPCVFKSKIRELKRELTPKVSSIT